MSRWLLAAIILLLFCGARSFIGAQDSARMDSSGIVQADSAHADSSRQIIAGTFTFVGYWIYENMRNTWLYWAYKLRPVTRTLAKIWHNLLYSSDDNSIIRTPLSKRK